MRSLPKTLVALAVLATASVASAQSLGDVARQERARRATAPPSQRVLTNEDLQREKILEPRTAQPAATQAAAEEVPAVPVLPPAEGVVPLWNAASSPEPSQITLGDFARQVRAERAARRRAREIMAQREQKIPVVAAAPAPAAPAPQPKRERVVAVVPSRRAVRPVTLHARKRRSAPRVVNVATITGDQLVVNRGDSLWKIAQREFGDGRMWTALWQANPEIADPNLIYAGQALRRPAAEQIAQQKTSRSAATLRASRKPQSSTSFAAQILTRDSRKAAPRTSETLPLLAPAPAAEGSRRSGPHRAPR
jgi:nucleoid-associated protein YgaU